MVSRRRSHRKQDLDLARSQHRKAGSLKQIEIWTCWLEEAIALLATGAIHPPALENYRPGIRLYPGGDGVLASPSSTGR